MAFMTSTSENESIMKNSAIQLLTDVHKITKMEKREPFRSIFMHDGGKQEMTLVDKGDFNGDGVLDLLLLSQNNVSGGSFSSTHLYALRMVLEVRKDSCTRERASEACFARCMSISA